MSTVRDREHETRLRPAVFFDRDGTLTSETDWVTHPDHVTLLPHAATAVALINATGALAVLVTNQSAVARGLLTELELAAVHAELCRALARQGAHLDGVYACPHHPTEGRGPYRRECECRKPKPGLLVQAARELDIDLARSFIVGDAERDLAAGAALGVHGVLVATGKGQREHARLSQAKAQSSPYSFAPDVLAAAQAIAATLTEDSAPSDPTNAA